MNSGPAIAGADAETALETKVPAARRSRARLPVLGLISVGTMINYLDRSVISVAAPLMAHDLGLRAAAMGLVFSAFSWSYVAAQLPGGVLLDRLGVRLTYFLSVMLWSGFTLLQGFAGGFASLLGFRLGLGIAEAPCYPCNGRVLSTWFPQQERARANGVYAVGQYVGLAFLSPLLFWIAARFGWRTLFLLVGALGLGFGPLWLRVYRDPSRSRANRAELDHIAAGGGLGDSCVRAPFRWSHLVFLLRQRQVLGASIGQFAGNCTLVFFLTWFPTYLATERHMTFLKVGIYAVLPFIAASLGVMTGGVLSDALLRRTSSPSLARKLPIVGGLLLASTIVGADFLSDNRLAILVMSVAFFGQGMVNLGFTVIADVAPKALFGLTAGLFNLCANLAGIVTPLVVGLIVAATGSFYVALAFIAGVALVGALAYVFLLGPVVRVEFDAG
jgi:ACS family D-galactonate transporter-like MFS transporter